MKNITAEATVDSNYFTIKANDVFFRYLDTTKLSTVKKIVHKDSLDSFTSMCDKAYESNSVKYAVLKILYLDENYYDTLVYAIKSNSCENSFVDIKFVNIMSLYGEYKISEMEIEKLRTVISYIEALCFSYNSATGNFSIYHMNLSNDIIIADGDFCNWKNEIIENNQINTESYNTFNSFCHDVISGASSFSYNIKSSFLSKGELENDILIKGNSFKKSDGSHTVSGMIKITDDNPRADYLMFEANRDGLTGLMNKKITNEISKIRIESKPNKPIHLVIIDIDNFKLINDNFGHLCGDNVLVQVAKIFIKCVGNKGMVGRIGGDEFFILFEGIANKDELRTVLRSIRMCIEAEFKNKFDGINVTCSIGVSEYPKDSHSYNELFKLADLALYIAKKKGKNRYVIYDVNMHGLLDDDSSDVSMSASLRELDKTYLLINVIQILNDGQSDKINRIIELLGKKLGINRLVFYYGQNLPLVSSWKMADWIADAFDKTGEYIYLDNFVNEFDEKNVYVLSHPVNLEDSFPNLFMHIKKDLIKSSVISILKNDDVINGVLSFELTTEKRKWSDNEVNVIAAITMLIQKYMLSVNK